MKDGVWEDGSEYSLKDSESAPRFSWWAWILPTLALVYAVFWGLLPGRVDSWLMVAATYFALMWWILIRRDRRGSKHLGLRIAWVAFAAWALLSHYIHASPMRISVVFFFLSALLMMIAADSQRWTVPALVVLGLFGSLNAAATVWLYFDESFFRNFIKPRFYAEVTGATGYMSGIAPHYSYNATYIVYSLLVVMSVLVLAKVSPPVRFLLLSLVVLNLFGLVLTSKRAHVLIAVLGIVVIFGISKARGRFFKLIFAATAIGSGLTLATAAIPGIGASVDRLLSSTESGDLNEVTTGRVVLWEEAIAGGNERPLTGQGWSTFYHSWGVDRGGASHAHNEFLEVFHSLGYPGVIVFSILIVVTIVGSYRIALRVCRSPEARAAQRVVAGAAFSIQLFLVVYGGTTGTLMTERFTYVVYFMSIAWLLSLSQVGISGRDAGTREPALPAGIKVGTSCRHRVNTDPVASFEF